MKANRIITILFAAALLLSGCGENSSDDLTQKIENAETVETADISNPFVDEDMDQSAQPLDTLGNFGWGINIADVQSLTYEDNKLVVPIKVVNEGLGFNFGIYAYVDGIIQPYSTSVTTEKNYLQCIEIPEYSELAYDIIIEDVEIANSKDESELALVSIVNPDYIPKSDELMGVNHLAVGLWPIELIMNTKPSTVNYKITSEYDSHIFTDEDISRFWINESMEDGSTVAFYLCPSDSENSPDWRYAVTDNGIQNLNLYIYSLNSGTGNYRISLYKNNEQVKFNGDCDYLDITYKDNYIDVAEISLTDIREGDFVYCVAVPMHLEQRVKKTSTIIFIDENEIPNYNSDAVYMPYVPEIDEDEYTNEDEINNDEAQFENLDPDEIGTGWINPYDLIN